MGIKTLRPSPAQWLAAAVSMLAAVAAAYSALGLSIIPSLIIGAAVGSFLVFAKRFYALVIGGVFMLAFAYGALAFWWSYG